MVLRTTTIMSMFLACCLLLQTAASADEAKPLVQEAAKPAMLPEGWFGDSTATLGHDPGNSKITPAVHVNSGGIDSSTVSSGGENGAANRLRSIRDAVGPIISDVKSDTPSEVNAAVKKFLGTSRRQKPAPAMSSVESSASQTSNATSSKVDVSAPATSNGLPSVMKGIVPPAAKPIVAARQPTIAAPTLAVPQPQSTTPRIAAPAKTQAVPEMKSTLKASNQIPNLAAPVTATPGTSMIKPGANSPTTGMQTTTPRVATLPQGQQSVPIRMDGGNVPYGNITVAPMADAKAGPQLAAPVRSLPQPANGAVAPRRPVSNRATVGKALSTPTASPVQPEDDILLSNRSPVLVVRTHGQQTIRVGQMATYYVSATNAGDLAAEDVVISVNVPSGAEITNHQASVGAVRIQPNGAGDNVMQWSITDLTPDARQRLKIDLIPRNSRPIDLGVKWNFKSVSAMAQIQVQEPKLQLSVVGPSDIQYGETKLYTITISNPGTGDAENVMLTLLPLNEATGSSRSKPIGTIKPGMRRTIEVELTARQAGELAVRALATADSGLKSNGKQDVLVRRPILKIEAVGPARKFAGANARYSIKVSNTGDATARNVFAMASLPMAAKYVDSSASGSFDTGKSVVNWPVGSLRPGAFKVLELSTNLMGAGMNRLEVRTTGDDQLAATGTVSTQVDAEADLKLTVDDPKGSIETGTEMEYEVRIVNRGTKAAHNVDVAGFFSEGIEPVSVRGWRADVEVGQVILETIPKIAPGQEIVVTVTAQASKAGHHVFRTELSSNDPETKLANEEWTRFHGDDKSPLSKIEKQALLGDEQGAFGR